MPHRHAHLRAADVAAKINGLEAERAIDRLQAA